MSSIDVIATTLGEAEPAFGAMSSPDGAITLMFCDLEDADAIRQELGSERAAELLRDHATIIGQIAHHHQGQIVKSHDDGFMVAFESAHAGLRCAVDMQQSLAGRTAGGGGRPLRIRVGMHTGFVITSNSDLFGRNVVLAARIAGQAKGSEILVSSALREYTATDPSFQFEPRGEHHFKGVLGEHQVFALNWVAAD